MKHVKTRFRSSHGAMRLTVVVTLLLSSLALGVVLALKDDRPPKGTYPPARRHPIMNGPDPWAAVPSSLGVNVEVSGLKERDLEMIAATGMKYVRIGFKWSRLVETKKGVYNWDRYDELRAWADKHGLTPLYLLPYSNGLYDTDGLTFNEASEYRGFAAYAAAAVKRYDAPGIVWEVGNEQNTDMFWKASTSGNTAANARERAKCYIALAKVAVPAMRKASPDAFIIIGGVHAINWRVTTAWLDEAYQRGALGLFDGLGVHTYGQPMLTREHKMIRGMARLRDQIADYGGPPDYPIFQTEFGIGLHNDDTTGSMEERLLQQAQTNIRMYLLMLMTDAKMNIWYEWRGHVKDERSMVGSGRKPRPIYEATGVLVRELAGYSYRSRIDLDKEDDYALLFEQGSRRKVVAWTVDDSHDVLIPVPDSAASHGATGMLGATKTLRRSGKQLTVRLSGSPVYVGVPKGH